jgi:hypothetical protein
MNDNMKEIYRVSTYKSMRSTKSITDMFFLYPEHTRWAMGSEFCDCGDCKILRINLIKVEEDSDAYKMAESNSKKWMEKPENADDPKPLALQNKYWYDSYKHCEEVRNKFVERLQKWEKEDSDICTYLTDSTILGGTHKFDAINIHYEDETITRIKKLGAGYLKEKEMKQEAQLQFNNLITLIKGVDTPEQLKALQELDHLTLS